MGYFDGIKNLICDYSDEEETRENKEFDINRAKSELKRLYCNIIDNTDLLLSNMYILRAMNADDNKEQYVTCEKCNKTFDITKDILKVITTYEGKFNIMILNPCKNICFECIKKDNTNF